MFIVILKLKNVNFTVIKILFFFEDKQIDNMLRCHKISYGEKNYKYFIGYMDDGHKIKSFSIILPKLSECGNIW